MSTTEAHPPPCPKAGRACPGDVDRQVARRMRERRQVLGLSLQELAELVGVSYQQLNRYEIGRNRPSVGQLYLVAEALGVGIGYFFEGVAPDRDSAAVDRRRRTPGLARSVAGLPDRRREALLELARALAEPAGSGEREARETGAGPG